MKNKNYLLLIPAFFLLFFSCSKVDDAFVKDGQQNQPSIDRVHGKSSAISNTSGLDTTDNLVVDVTNLLGNAVFAKVSIIPAMQYGTDIYTKIINYDETAPDPVTRIYFSLPYGLSYQVAVTDTYGQVYYGPVTTASFEQIFFPLQISAPSVLPPALPPSLPGSNTDTTTHHAPLPTGMSYYTIIVDQNIENHIAVIELVAADSYTVLKTKSMLTYASGTTQLQYEFKASFDLAVGTKFRVALRHQNGAVSYSEILQVENYNQVKVF